MKRKAAVKPFGTLTKPISEEIGFVYSLQPTPPESDVGFVIIWSNPKTAGGFYAHLRNPDFCTVRAHRNACSVNARFSSAQSASA